MGHLSHVFGKFFRFDVNQFHLAVLQSIHEIPTVVAVQTVAFRDRPGRTSRAVGLYCVAILNRLSHGVFCSPCFRTERDVGLVNFCAKLDEFFVLRSSNSNLSVVIDTGE